MSAGRPQRKACRDNTRSLSVAVLDRLFQPDIVAIARPHVTHSGEPGLQHRLGIADGGHAPETVGKLQPAITADIGGAVQMDVHVDQTGQDRLAGQINVFDVAPPLHGARIGDAGDAAVGTDEYRRVADDFAGENVDHLVGGDDGVLRHRGGRKSERASKRDRYDSPFASVDRFYKGSDVQPTPTRNCLLHIIFCHICSEPSE